MSDVIILAFIIALFAIVVWVSIQLAAIGG